MFSRQKSKQKNRSKYRPRPRHPIFKALTVRSFEYTPGATPAQCIQRLERVIDTRLLTVNEIGEGDIFFQFSGQLLDPLRIRRPRGYFRTQVAGILSQ